MKILQEVYDLIKSLDQEEKNIFNALSNIKCDANQKEYYMLYELLDK